MKLIVVISVLTVAALQVQIQVQASPLLDSVPDTFDLFKLQFGKSYSTGDEETMRSAIFEQNLRRIATHNSLHDLGLKSFRLGVNQFADLTNEEFRRTYNGLHRSRTNRPNGRFHHHHNPAGRQVLNGTLADGETLPKSVDWRKKGLVTPVKNQGQCGSCWAFSAVASLEGQHAKATGKLVSLSEQNLVDCSAAEGNEGCDGGLMDNAFEYIETAGGIDTEKSYPYQATDGQCRFKKSKVGATVTGYTDVESGSEKALQKAVAKVGPISVAIDASSEEFQLYASGVYAPDECSSVSLDHGVTAVGYGTVAAEEETGDGNGPKDFWWVKNSWGKDWGLAGYVKMARNYDNSCGIATQASYPQV